MVGRICLLAGGGTALCGAAACALVLLGVGCSLLYREDYERRQCTEQADCSEASKAYGVPLVCRANACQQALCMRNEECPASSTCISNMCVGTQAGAETQAACTLDAECGLGNRCGFDGFCYVMWGCLDVDRERPVAPPTVR